jgi:hypothetical protein
MAFNWTCPHCNRPQTQGKADSQSGHHHFYLDSLAEGSIGLSYFAQRCVNPDCKHLTLHVSVGEDEVTRTPAGTQHRLSTLGQRLWTGYLLPRGSAKPQPSYIPRAIIEDYIEACLIRDLSPKASATLARRCLQGIIRDFAKISKSRLVDEIAELRRMVSDAGAPPGVTPESVEAIDHVRGIGNIGAHMAKDVDVIVAIDPDEAQLLIELIETLFDEWYVARNSRQERLSKIAQLSAEKKRALADASAARQGDKEGK